MIVVGDAETFSLGEDASIEFYPLIDSDTGETFGDVLYRYRDHAQRAADAHNNV